MERARSRRRRVLSLPIYTKQNFAIPDRVLRRLSHDVVSGRNGTNYRNRAGPLRRAIPNSTVKVLSIGTGTERTATTSSSGNFAVANLLPGDYTVTVDASGFAP